MASHAEFFTCHDSQTLAVSLRGAANGINEKTKKIQNAGGARAFTINNLYISNSMHTGPLVSCVSGQASCLRRDHTTRY